MRTGRYKVTKQVWADHPGGYKVLVAVPGQEIPLAQAVELGLEPEVSTAEVRRSRPPRKRPSAKAEDAKDGVAETQDAETEDAETEDAEDGVVEAIAEGSPAPDDDGE